MLLLYVGGVELGNGLAIGVKVSETAHTVATWFTKRMRHQLSAEHHAWRVVGDDRSLFAVNAAVTVSEVSTDANGKATVTWSKALNGTPRQ